MKRYRDQTSLKGVRMKIAVIIPSYRVKSHIKAVIEAVGDEVAAIYVVDDCCPEESGKFVETECHDPRLKVLYNKTNMGVGGATLKGFSTAVEDGADILVKLDGDGQMDPAALPQLIGPLLEGYADYAKGNRFFELEMVAKMPKVRLLGNLGLSFMTKLSSGYWRIFDPTNGFFALHASVYKKLPVAKVAKRFFFESDMLFRLGTLQAVIIDVPMPAIYGNESSNLNSFNMILPFLSRHLVNFHKRIFYNYFLRDFTLASLELILGSLLLLFGSFFGISKWKLSITTGIPVTSGTVMLAALPVLVGIQMLLSFFSYDISNAPVSPIHKRL
jgi:dolichol-phosphate mannosyltransferase